MLEKAITPLAAQQEASENGEDFFLKITITTKSPILHVAPAHCGRTKLPIVQKGAALPLFSISQRLAPISVALVAAVVQLFWQTSESKNLGHYVRFSMTL